MSSIVSILVSVPLVAIAIIGVGFVDSQSDFFESVEVGIAELSPAGETGGFAVPASATSCPYGCGGSHGGSGGKDGQPSHCSVCNPPPPPPPDPVTVDCSNFTVSPSSIPEGYSGNLTLTRNSDPNNGEFSTTLWVNGVQRGGSGGFTTIADDTWNSPYVPSSIGTYTYAHYVMRRVNGEDSGWELCPTRNVTVTTAKNLVARNTPVVSGALLAGETVTFSNSAVENNGSVDVTDNFQNRYEIDIDGDGSITPISSGGVDIVRSTGQITLDQGQTFTPASETWNNPLAGTYQVRFRVDSNNAIPETNETESNNTTGWRSFTITEPTPPSGPDIKVTKDPQPPATINDGDVLTFTGARVKNGGQTDITSNFNNRYEVDIDGDGIITPVSSGGVDITRATGDITLAADVFEDVTANNTWNADAGVYKIRLVADYRNDIPEDNENNNVSDWVEFKVLGNTECADGIDNSDPEDALIDENDPGCWTNPTDPNTYDPTDDDETHTVPIQANLTAERPPTLGPFLIGDPIVFTGAVVENVGGTDVTNTFKNRYEIDLDRDGFIDGTDPTRGAGTLPSLSSGASSSALSATNQWSATVGLHRVRFRADWDDDVSESSNNDNNSSWRNFEVIDPANQPNIEVVSDPVVGGTLVEGQTVEFSGVNIQNTGSGDVVNSFKNRYEIDLNRDGSVDITRGVGNVPSLAVSDPPVSFGVETWANATAGDHRVRFFADWDDDVTSETSEADNISPWINFTVSSSGSGPTPVTTLEIRELGTGSWGSSVTVDSGDDVEVRWSSTDADRCVGDTYVSTGNATSGTDDTLSEPSAGNSRTYTVTCHNDGAGTQHTDSVTVNVNSGGGSTPVISATPQVIRWGDTAEIDWDRNGNSSCTITGTNGDSFAADPGAGSQITSPLIADTLYTIDCGGGLTADALVTVLPKFEEI